MKSRNYRSKLVFLTVLFVVLVNYPVLSVFSRPILIGGIPLLFLYLFVVWVLFLFLVFRLVNKNHDQ
ncbi:MAG: hypothetical protein CFE21_03325 [Bacteroidetes bacterium B1(2017)]|nr:MAG: hypothetical protein CFE21_03325 [Bacteroidetes bacterium B1(2017)]